MKWNKAGLLAMSFIFFAGLATAGWAQDEEESGKTDLITSRTYVGFMGISETIDQWGDFQGTHTFASSSSSGTTVAATEVDLVPSITRNFGWGAMVGHREGPWAVECSFTRSDHTATFIYSGPVTFETPANLCAIDLNFKRYFLTPLPVQPFALVGLSLPWLWVRQGSYLYDTYPGGTVVGVDDETISGIGFNLGAGLEVYVTKEISIVGGVFQRFTSFDQINGAAKIPFNSMYFDGNPNDVGAIEGDGLHIYAGSTFAFQL